MVRSRRMIVVGLTGGIGSGKSTVSRLLARRGAAVLDADDLVHELQAPGGEAFEVIRRRFGPAVVAPDGSLDRSALATTVFADHDARVDLERLVHPLVRRVIRERISALRDTTTAVVIEIPLLAEGRAGYSLSAVMVVDCPVDTAVRRLVEGRGMSEADARRRVAAQAGGEERRAIADFVVDNSRDLAALDREVDRAWSWIQGLPPAPASPA